MIELYTKDPIDFELSVAAYMDLAVIVKTTYEMEGERLEDLVLFSRIEKLRALGWSLAGAHSGILIHTEAALRRPLNNPEIGLRFSKDFGSHGWFGGTVNAIEEHEGSKVFKVVYDDTDEEELDLDELRELLDAYGKKLYGGIVERITPAFDYLESRLTGTCQKQYDCSHSYKICELLRVFDPSFVSEQGETINGEWVRRLECVKPFAPLVDSLVRDLHLYVSTTRGFTCNRSSVGDFTDSVLLWWRNHYTEVGSWADAARIAFAFTPNSASAERAFSLLKNLFGDRHDSANADMTQASMMLRYNKREL